MLKELLKHDDFGSFDNLVHFHNTLIIFRGEKSEKDLRKYFQNKSISLIKTIDALVDLYIFLGYLERNGNALIIRDCLFKDPEFSLSKEFYIKRLFQKMIDFNLLHEFIKINNIKYNPMNDCIMIPSSTIPLEFSGVRNFLIDLEIFLKPDIYGNIFINKNFEDYFKEFILNNKSYFVINEIINRPFSYKELLDLQKKKELYGEEAEKFVQNYETARLMNHPQKENIKIISQIDISAGYDILSYNDENSKCYDRFIEVKSFDVDCSFYWSRNEMEVAEVKQNRYFLYLVDRSQMNLKNYVPIIIMDPYKEILDNDIWIKEVESFKITKSLFS
jgi:hypothetical protein